MPKAPAAARFRKLVDDITRLYAGVRRAQVNFAWETGRRIVEEEQDSAPRAAYSDGLITRLSLALTAQCGPGFSTNTLRKMRQFYLLNRIQPLTVELGWSEQVELLPVRDEKARRQLERRIVKESLNCAEIRKLVRAFRRGTDGTSAPAAPLEKPGPVLPALKRPAGLRFHGFPAPLPAIKRADGRVLVDCGFFVFWPVAPKELAALNLTETPSYTYPATVERVIDGDTLLVLIEAGFGIVVRSRLRLRGVDCPELGTPAGERAKSFVERLLPAGGAIAVKSHKSRVDLHGRFVVDVFHGPGVTAGERVPDSAGYLNQQLLDEALAVRAAG
jgi:hypothetical protein